MRGKQSPKRPIKSDEMYGSVLVSKFINYIMLDGKKTVARDNVYKALEELSKKTKKDASEALDQALKNIKPTVEVRSRRVGGSNYQVPVQVPEGRQVALAFRWLIDGARSSRGSAPFYMSLARELISAFNNEGNAVKKKEDVRKMAEANRAFAQFG